MSNLKLVLILFLTLSILGCTHKLSDQAQKKASKMPKSRALLTLNKYFSGVEPGVGICPSQPGILEGALEPFRGINESGFSYDTYYLDNCTREITNLGDSIQVQTKCNKIPFIQDVNFSSPQTIFIVRTIDLKGCNLDDGAIQISIRNPQSIRNPYGLLRISIPEDELEKFLIAYRAINPNTSFKNAY
ncbi:hypothetical protein A9Q81_15950 [Gammaproteobacteria bacterium 42_54_T18]|nr:hypothetical protein A9Q81_15950 [Gammaproteobacteria bacterium 42_54_T18]